MRAAYAFGRTTNRTSVVDGRAHKTSGHRKPMPGWQVLLTRLLIVEVIIILDDATNVSA